MTRRSSRAPLIAAVDMFVCFAVVLFIILGQPQAEIEQQISRKKEELILLDRAVELRREQRRALEAQTKQAQEEERARAQKAEQEAQARIAQLEGEIASTREQLQKRQQQFTDWDVVVERFRTYSNSIQEPDYHFYLRPNGIYTALRPNEEWSRSRLKAWLGETAAQLGREPSVAFYAENGANDQVRTVHQVVDEVNRPTPRVIITMVTLPSGVVAGKGYHIKGDAP